jgi:protein-S-isoprenylcysteine O-methyltransferase Ste14
MNTLTLYLISYLLLISGGFILFRYLVPRDYLKHGKLSPFITFLQAILFFIFGGFPTIYLDKTWPRVTVPILFHAVGVSLICIGLGILIYGMIRLGVFRSLGRGKAQLIKSGLYGFFTLWPSWYAAGWALLYMILIHLMILAEEAHLKRVYGQEYVRYCREIPRYLGKPFYNKLDSA